MAPHHVARLRLFALGVAVACRTAVYLAATVQTVFVNPNGTFLVYQSGLVAAWLTLCAFPALAVVPLAGAVAGSRWNRAVLIAGPALCAVLALWVDVDYWDTRKPMSLLVFLTLELAFFGPAVAALVPAMVRAARLTPTTAGVWLVVSAAAAAWGCTNHGVISATELPPWLWSILYATALIAVLFARAPSRESASLASGIMRPFLAGVRGALGHRRARHSLAGLWLWSFVAMTAVVVLCWTESRRDRVPSVDMPEDSVEVAAWWFAATFVIGVVLSAVNRHPYRHAGFVPYAALAAASSVLCLRFWDTGTGPLIGLGFALGLALSPLLNLYLTWIRPGRHGVAAALIFAGWSAGALALAAVLVSLGDDPMAARTPLLNILLAVTALAFVTGFAVFFRPAMELTLEVLLGPVYRIRAVGPGLDHLPVRGPCLVIGNHAGWFDPLFFAKIVPAPITPMMISRFYDLPVLAWLMRHVIGTIRVPDKTVRHEAPELKEAVAALDRGEYVILFPEGYLRRKEEVPLRRFGRGIWQILNDRPDTPLFTCWIDGAWGSYFSYRGGPPTKGKRLDFWRRIRIGVLGPIAVDPVTLKDHMVTRTFLMSQVTAARRPLGLEPLELPTTGEPDGDKE